MLRAPGTIATLLLAAIAACTGCVQEDNGFAYTCMPGGGMFDGISCEVPLTRNFLLWYPEDGDGPGIHETIDGLEGHAEVIPGTGKTQIRKVGFDSNWLVAGDSNDGWYVVDLRGAERGAIVGPLSLEELRVRFPSLPPTRDVPTPRR
jgi:hypothetical protein